MPDGYHIEPGELRRALQGREIEVLHSLNITPAKQGHVRCPFPEHEDRNPSWRWDFKKGRYFCSCPPGSGDIFDVVQNVIGGNFMDAVQFVASVFGTGNFLAPSCQIKRGEKNLTKKTEKKSWSNYAESLWLSCNPLSGDAVKYLLARRCAIPPVEGDLRCHPNLENKKNNWNGPALVGRVTDAVTNEPMTLHLTWFTPDGTKAPIRNPRLLLKGHSKQGGVIRLWPDEDVTYGLGIAEGIENALSAAHGFTPVWSAIDKGNLSQLSVIGGVEALTIFADPEVGGVRAANQCAKRWFGSGKEVRIWKSPNEKEDFNDWIAA